MPAITGKQGQPEPSKTVQYRDFSLGLVRTGSRSGIPDTGLFTMTNVQVIGPGQLATLTDPGPSIVALTPGPASLWGVIIKLTGLDVTRIIAIRTDGSITAVDPASGATTGICAAGVMSSLTRVAMWRDTHVLFGDPTHGFASWDGTTFVAYPGTFTGTTTSGLATITWTSGTIPATALIAGMGLAGAGIPAGATILSVVGTTITMSANATASGSVVITVGAGAPATIFDLAVFNARVWLQTSTRGFVFSGPGAFTTFTSDYAAGADVLTDPIFQGQIERLISAMQLLWVVGPAAVNTISNVQVVAGVTTFQNENLVAGIGTPWGDSVQPLFRTLFFLAHSGIHAILGATPQKLSDQLDDLIKTTDGAGASGPGAVFTLNNITVYGVLVDVAGLRRLLVYSRPTWFVADQGAVTWITQVVRTTGEIQCWGTDGTNIFQLFAGQTGSFLIESKLFDYGMFVQRKQVVRVAVEAEVTGLGTADLRAFLQNESTTEEAVGSPVPVAVTWINNVGDPVTWINNVSGPVTWVAAGRIIISGEARFSGNLVGFKLMGTNSVPLTISAFAWEMKREGEWTLAS